MEIDEDDYFSRLIGEDITVIVKELKEIHKKDKKTSDNPSPLSEALEIIEEFEQTSGPMKNTPISTNVILLEEENQNYEKTARLI